MLSAKVLTRGALAFIVIFVVGSYIQNPRPRLAPNVQAQNAHAAGADQDPPPASVRLDPFTDFVVRVFTAVGLLLLLGVFIISVKLTLGALGSFFS